MVEVRSTGSESHGTRIGYLSYLETGRRSPSSQMLAALADALDRGPEWLRSGCDSNATQRIAVLFARCHEALHEGSLSSAEEGLRELLDRDMGRPLTRDEMDQALLFRALVMGRQGRDRAAIEILAPLVANLLNGKCGLPPVLLGRHYLSAASWVGVAGEIHTGVWQKAVGQAHQILTTIPRSDRDDAWWRLAATAIGAQADMGNVHAAVIEAESWLAELEQAGSDCPSGVAALRWNLGVALAELGWLTEALAQLEVALRLHDSARYPGDGARLKLAYASVLMRSGPADVETAIDVLEATLPEFGAHSYPQDLHQWHVYRARAEILAERPEAAQSFLDPVLAEQMDDAGTLHDAWLTKGDAWMALGDVGAVREAYERAGLVDRWMPERRGLARRWRDVGDRLSRLGCSAEAADAYRRALTVLDVPELPGVQLSG